MNPAALDQALDAIVRVRGKSLRRPGRVSLDLRGQVAELVIDNPPDRHALTFGMMEDLGRAVKRLREWDARRGARQQHTLGVAGRTIRVKIPRAHGARHLGPKCGQLRQPRLKVRPLALVPLARVLLRAAAAGPAFLPHALAQDVPRFALGVASGDPSLDGFVIWTRLVGPMGEALDGSGVAANGMCPSLANKPEVGSSPTQPAPGRNTSHHACKSVKSSSGPFGPSNDF